ncbi:MAG: alpha/beta fold hydrolase [Blastocatellia bacterium]
MTRLQRILIGAFLMTLALAAGARAQTPATETKQVEIYGQKIYYLEAGSPVNPKVILLHGLGGDMNNWAMTLPALAAKYHVLALDQIGFGKSDKPILNYRVATMVEFLDQFYGKLGIEKASLVGNSLGAWTAAAFAIAHPQKVEKLVLAGGAGLSSKRWNGPALTNELFSILNPSTTAGVRRTFEMIFYNKTFISDAFVTQAFTARLKRGSGQVINSLIESMLRGEDYVDEKIKTIKAPTLVVWGREDRLTPLAMGEAFAKDIPGAQLLVFDQCAHVPQMEKPAEFNAAVLKFLAAATAASSALK